jgi:hypothetical protein
VLVMKRRGKEKRTVPETSTWEMDESPPSPCLASPLSRVIIVRPSRATPCCCTANSCRLPLPTQLPTQPPSPAAANTRVRYQMEVSLRCQNCRYVTREHFFFGGLEWRFLFGSWEGRKAGIRRDFYRDQSNRSVFYGPNHFCDGSKFSGRKGCFSGLDQPNRTRPNKEVFSKSSA